MMVLMTIINDVFGESVPGWPHWLAGLLGWAAAALLVKNLSVVQRYQAAAIAVVGLGLMLLADRRGASIDVAAAIGNNASLISMIAAVGFLRLITLSTDSDDERLPVGPQAYLKTLLGVSVFGSVINLSAPIIFADRLAIESKLDRLTSQSFTRIFSGCSAWSPFFGGMAVVLTYVPAMRLSFVMMACLPFAVIGFIVVAAEARLRYNNDLQKFRGYPVQYSNLWVPLALALIVIVLSRLAPQWSILTCISSAALMLTLVVLLVRIGLAATAETLRNQVIFVLPGTVNELILFLVAGLLASGLASVVASGLVSIASFEFHATEAVVLLGIMILAAIIGVHPVVTVSGATPLIMTLEPNANLLAVAYLLAWSLGTCASPLSGTHLVFQGRYGVPGWKGASWNWPFVLLMFLVAIPILHIVDALV